jgi:hypothetical protein
MWHVKANQHGLVVLHCLKYVVYMAAYWHLVKILYRWKYSKIFMWKMLNHVHSTYKFLQSWCLVRDSLCLSMLNQMLLYHGLRFWDGKKTVYCGPAYHTPFWCCLKWWNECVALGGYVCVSYLCLYFWTYLTHFHIYSKRW